MPHASWDEVLQSPEYAEALRAYQSRRQQAGRALPAAGSMEALRPLIAAQGEREQVATRLGQGQQLVDLDRRKLAFQQRLTGIAERRRPLAVGLSLAGLGVQGLSAYGTLRQGQTTQQSLRDLMAGQKRTGALQESLYNLQIDYDKRRREALAAWQQQNYPGVYAPPE